MSLDATLYTTSGLSLPGDQFSPASIVTQGMVTALPTTPPPLTGSESNKTTVVQDLTKIGSTLENLSRVGALTLFTPTGTSVFPAGTPTVSILNSLMSFNPLSGAAKIVPALDNIVDAALGAFENNTTTFTGSDMRILLEVITADLPANFQVNMTKALVECSTLTVSTHREKAPVRACGYINPKGFARGRRTIAGTLVLTQFTVDVLFRFLQAVLPQDFSKDTTYLKVDQLPPFNATILFSDEYGNASYRRLLGLEFVTDGTVYSIHDMLTEQTVSYMASDFTPLMPVNYGVIFNPRIIRGLSEMDISGRS